MYKVILASNSPRRKELLAGMGVEFEAIPSQKEEVMTKDNPSEVVLELSQQKAEDVATMVEGQSIIIGADTVVAIDGMILGKPKDEDDAIRMVGLLQGRSHSVYTGVSIIIKEGKSGNDNRQRLIQFAEETKVYVYPMSKEEICNYVATKEPMDKAGAYGIQGKFATFIKGLEGDYYNVVGFPVGRIYQTLKQEGIQINTLKRG